MFDLQAENSACHHPASGGLDHSTSPDKASWRWALETVYSAYIDNGHCNGGGPFVPLRHRKSARTALLRSIYPVCCLNWQGAEVSCVFDDF